MLELSRGSILSPLVFVLSLLVFSSRSRVPGLKRGPLGKLLVDGLLDWLPPWRLCIGSTGESDISACII